MEICHRMKCDDRGNPAGKRRNALRHGLTAETVIEVFERLDHYRRFHQRPPGLEPGTRPL